jgi:glycosyltransferase involved in cell wall biosynthesis
VEVRVLLSGLACSPQLGSESLVGYRAVEAICGRFEVEVVTSAGMRAPPGVKTHTIDVKFDDPNDVGASQLLRYELRQLRCVGRLLRRGRFDLFHRATPSGYKASLLPVPSVPMILGPVLGSESPPASFDSIFRPRLPRSFKSIAPRIGHGVARRAFARFSTLNRLIENAALILAGTEVTRRLLPERLHPRCRPLTYAGVEHDLFTPPTGRRLSNPCQLLFVGRVVPYKGVELLLRAVAAARRRCKFGLKIIGSGDPAYRRFCQRLAANLELSDSVTFIDRISREALIEIYRSADIFCMPSIETYGLAILEAMSSGCVPLVADLNGPGEIVRPGTGLKVPLETPDQFLAEYAERIVQLVEDARLRVALGEAAREHVVRFHDWKAIKSSLLDTYEEVISNRRAVAESAPICGGPGSL